MTKDFPVSDLITPAWFREASVYQIYPASFNDSNGDGIGDLQGIIEKLDYIKSLNVDVVWLSPINKSPLVDMGYDISDYKDIDPRYGDLETFDLLIKEMKKRNLKFVLDLVVNHSSDQHPWFIESRSSKTNPKHDWYIWKPAKYDSDGNRQPPNNWSSHFTPSAWKWDEIRQEYYLCLFADEQPDLNWENPEVREAVKDIVTFWLERGVSGFRLDVINFISKVPTFPDAEPDGGPGPYYSGHEFYANGPHLHEYLQELGAIFKKYDAFTVGEMPHVDDPEEILKIVRADRNELNMIFQFDLVNLDSSKGSGKFTYSPFKVDRIKKAIEKWQTVIPNGGGWNAVFIENHDQARAISRYLSDDPAYRAYASKLIALLIVFQSGTPFIYQGQELALANIPAEWSLDEYLDVETIHSVSEFKKTDPSKEEWEAFLKLVHTKARDHARTPMHWDDSENSGFTTSTKPWMRVTGDYKVWNAKNQVDDLDSVFRFWSNSLQLRKKLTDIVVYGSFELVSRDDANVVAFIRTARDETKRVLVILNFTSSSVSYSSPVLFSSDQIDLNNYKAISIKGENVQLEPYQGLIVSI